MNQGKRMRCQRLVVGILVMAAVAVGAGKKEAKAEYSPVLPPRESLELAIRDLMATHGADYPRGAEFLERLESARTDEVFETLRREALLDNPLLNDAQIIMLRRNLGDSARKLLDRDLKKKGNGVNLGLPWRNTQDNTTIAHATKGWDNDIVVLSDLREPIPKLDSVYKRADGAIITDLELDFDAQTIMYSSIGTHDRWHVFEMDLAELRPRQITPTDTTVEDFFDSCFLPDGRIVFASTHQFNGIPCENGSSSIAVPVLYDPENGSYRQIGFDQESSWNYSVMNDGRLLYLRWEYTDTPHFFTRLPFTCNPDGANQRAYYGSNSYWPNSFYGLRAIPGHPTKIVGTVTGHHGLSRMGRLMILDPAKGTFEADGVVQSIPGHGRTVEPVIEDRLYNNVYPKFLTPWPLSEKYFLTIMKPAPDALWGLYLVDVFDNLLLLHEQEGMFYIDPILLKPRLRPPAVPDRIQLDQDDATVLIQDIYTGPGLKNIPRGAVEKLRVFTYNYSVTFSGADNRVGIESGWDVKTILGTVPVENDGSAFFTVPANLPIAIQPLDKNGAAMQLFRSWFTAMPGENLSCIGCHEGPGDAPRVNGNLLALKKPPARIEPWNGPVRPFGFSSEVQPLLDKRCAACHNEEQMAGGMNLARQPMDYSVEKFDKRGGSIVSPSYRALQRFVRRPGPESDYQLLNPMEFHASTSELVQMLKAGHHNVGLTQGEWEILYTWIDLNAPYHGSVVEQNGGLMSDNWWNNKKDYVGMDGASEILGCEQQRGIDVLYDRRLANLNRFAGRTDDQELAFQTHRAGVLEQTVEPILPESVPEPSESDVVEGWPFQAEPVPVKSIQIGKHELRLRLIPAGSYVRSGKAVKIDHPFYMAENEISNAMYALFDPAHDSKYKDLSGKDHKNRGIPLNRPEQPVVRVSPDRAQAFCEWLSKETGMQVSLPTATEWEWAARAGTDTPFWFGDLSADFSSYANLADQQGNKIAPFPTVKGFNDKHLVSAPVDAYKPNPWGLKNMHGNANEWARDGDQYVACGGSWQDRPHRATADSGIPYEAYQPVMNVGFRIIVAP